MWLFLIFLGLMLLLAIAAGVVIKYTDLEDKLTDAIRRNADRLREHYALEAAYRQRIAELEAK